MKNILVHHIRRGWGVTTSCGVTAGSISGGYQHSAHHEITDADVERYAAGPIHGLHFSVCSKCLAIARPAA